MNENLERPLVELETSKGKVILELFEDEAPNTVANFVQLIESGFYDGLKFHRVIEGFMAQGGCPTGTGTGGPGHKIKCECGAPDAKKHSQGAISMAHAGKNTGGSQFFITFAPTSHLDGVHTVFGKVIEGMEAIDNLNITDRGEKPDSITKATVTRKRDHDYSVEKI
ncbi:MAG: peptidylprolyl isomerase [Pirellulaceae bacterium]|nr:peptidylprolyl isomerase [Planctomycetaceae bacterium]